MTARSAIFVVWQAGKPETAVAAHSFREMSVLVNGTYGKSPQSAKYFARLWLPIDPELSLSDIAREFERYVF